MAIEDFATLNMRMRTTDFESGQKRTISGLQQIRRFATKAFAFAGISIGTKAIVDYGKKAISSAADAQEQFSKFDAIFDTNTMSANKVAEEFQKSYGLAESTAKEMLSTSADLMTGFGFTDEAALEMSQKVNSLSVDLASFTNLEGGSARASEALTKALLGESEQAKALGIVIRQDSDEYKNLVKRGQELEGLTLLQSKAMAALTIATNQSQNAIGDYARTQDSVVNISRRVDEGWKTLTETIGQSIIVAVEFDKILANVAEGLSGFTKFIKEMNPNLKTFTVRATILTGALAVMGTGIFVVKDALAIRNVLLNKATVSTIANTVATGSNTKSLLTNTVAVNANFASLRKTALINQGLLNRNMALTKSAGGLKSAFGGVGKSLGSVAAIGTAAFVGWGIGRTINKVTGLDNVLKDLYGRLFFGSKKSKEEAASLDSQIKENLKTLNKSGRTGDQIQGIAVQKESDFKKLAREKEIKRLKEISDKIASSEFNFALRRATVEEKIDMLRRKQEKQVAGGDFDAVQFAEDGLAIKELEEKKILDIQNAQKNLDDERFQFTLRRAKTEEKITLLQDKQSQILKNIEKETDPLKKIALQRKLLESQSQIAGLEAKEEKKAAKPTARRETSIVDAVQKGSLEALKIENTTLKTDAKIETNTRKNEKNTKEKRRHGI